MNKGKKTLVGILVGGMLLGTSMSFSAKAGDNDPLVSLSYLNTKLEEVRNYVDNKVSSNPGGGTASSLEVVQLEKGDKILAGAGTELILRSGRATAIGSYAGGLSDTTAAKDINTGENVEQNHLLIVPRDDSRGLYAESNSVFIMVRGSYRLEK